MNIKQIRRTIRDKLPPWVFNEFKLLVWDIDEKTEVRFRHSLDFFTRDWHAVGTGRPHYTEHYINAQRQAMDRLIKKYNILDTLMSKFVDLSLQEIYEQSDNWACAFYGWRGLNDFTYRMRQCSIETGQFFIDIEKVFREKLMQEEE